MVLLMDIQSTDWETEVIQNTKPVMVEFWHHKCPVCIEMKPLVEKLPELFGDEVKFTRMNLLESKENRRFAIESGIRSTPTFVIYSQGVPTGQIIGGLEEPNFVEAIRDLIEVTNKYKINSTNGEE